MHEVVRRGDYYEIEIAEREMPAEAKKKPEQPNPNICTDNASQEEVLARLSLPPKLQITDNRILALREELRLIEKELASDKKADTNDIRETKELLMELAALEVGGSVKVDIPPFKKDLVGIPSTSNTVEYKLMLPVSTTLQQRVRRLQQIDYPRMGKLEQLTSVLVGQHFANQQKLTRSKQPIKLESKAPLFNRYQKLQATIDEFPQLVERITNSEGVHCEIARAVSQFKQVAALHHEMLEEVNEDAGLIAKLAANFEENKKKLTATMGSFRERLQRLKKK